MTPHGQQQKIKRLQALGNELEFWAKRKLTRNDGDIHQLTEALDTATTIKQVNQPDAALCAKLRCNALQAAHYSPVISAYLDLMANELDPRTTH